MSIQKHWKSIGILSFLMTLGILASCSRELATVPTIPFTPTNSPTPMFTATNTKTFTPVITNTPTFTNTPCLAGGNTCTPTLTFTKTNTPTGPTATPTGTPAGAIVFENWEGPYSGGNMWASFAGCGAANYQSNPYINPPGSAAMTTCYDSTAGDPHNGSYCWRGNMTWNALGTTAQFGLDSAYGGDYGFPINISATTPSALSLWLKSDMAPTQFTVYFQDTSGSGSASPNHTTTNVNTFTITTPNTWTNFVLPLTPGTSVWSVDPTTMNYAAILDIGTVIVGPVAGTPPITQNIYFDDYYFYP